MNCVRFRIVQLNSAKPERLYFMMEKQRTLYRPTLISNSFMWDCLDR